MHETKLEALRYALAEGEKSGPSSNYSLQNVLDELESENLMASFILTQKARGDLLSIGRYTRKQWGSAQQIHYLTQLDLGRECDDIRAGYYKYGVDKHVIFYHHTERSQSDIIRILRVCMDIEKHLLCGRFLLGGLQAIKTRFYFYRISHSLLGIKIDTFRE